MKQRFIPQAKECFGWESDMDADEDDEEPDQPENDVPDEDPEGPDEQDKDTEDADQPADDGLPSPKAMNAMISQMETFTRTFDEENAQQPSIRRVEVPRANVINDEELCTWKFYWTEEQVMMLSQ